MVLVELRWDSVIEWQAERVLTFHHSERFTHFESLDSLREWAGFYIAYEHSYQEGCSLGSLASEIIKTDLDVRTELANAFRAVETSSKMDSAAPCFLMSATKPSRCDELEADHPACTGLRTSVQSTPDTDTMSVIEIW